MLLYDRGGARSRSVWIYFYDNKPVKWYAVRGLDTNFGTQRYSFLFLFLSDGGSMFLFHRTAAQENADKRPVTGRKAKRRISEYRRVSEMGIGFWGKLNLLSGRNAVHHVPAWENGDSSVVGDCASAAFHRVFGLSFPFQFSMPGERNAGRIFVPEESTVSDVMDVVKAWNRCAALCGIQHLSADFRSFFSIRGTFVSAGSTVIRTEESGVDGVSADLSVYPIFYGLFFGSFAFAFDGNQTGGRRFKNFVLYGKKPGADKRDAAKADCAQTGDADGNGGAAPCLLYDACKLEAERTFARYYGKYSVEIRRRI